MFKFKEIARKPIPKMGTYTRFGFVIVRHEYHQCPRCKNTLNAGPNYQPKYCDQCGQKVDFSGTVWKAEEEIGVIPLEQRRVQNE
jgi:ribosomal protein L37AE/L43A